MYEDYTRVSTPRPIFPYNSWSIEPEPEISYTLKLKLFTHKTPFVYFCNNKEIKKRLSVSWREAKNEKLTIFHSLLFTLREKAMALDEKERNWSLQEWL